MVRHLLFALYGMAIGGLEAWLLLVGLAHASGIGLAAGVCLGSLFVGLLGFQAARMPGTDHVRVLLMPLTPVVLTGTILALGIGLGAMLLWLAVGWPIAAVVALRKERRFRQHLQSQGRFLTASDLVSRLESGRGTLIEEAGFKGLQRIWWTDDRIEDALPEPGDLVTLLNDPQQRLENRRRFYAYLDAHTGQACLSSVRPRRRELGVLAGQFPQIRHLVIVEPPYPGPPDASPSGPSQ